MSRQSPQQSTAPGIRAAAILPPLDRDSYVPLYAQIRERLRACIQERLRQTPGVTLPFFTDDDLVRRWGVSRMTVRQAVNELIREGLLHRVRGVGTFIRPPQVTGQLTHIERFFDEWRIQGWNVRVDVTAFEQVPCPPTWASTLGVAPGQPVVHIGRLRRMDDLPTATDTRYLPLDLGSGVTIEDIQSESLFVTLARKYSIPIERADVELEAQAATASVARELQIRRRDPVLVRTVSIYGGGRPLLTGRSIYRGDAFKYSFSIPGEDVPAAPGNQRQ